MSLSANTPTNEVVEVYRGKTDLLREWEEAPIDIQVRNRNYIRGLTNRIRKLRVYFSHRRNSPYTYDP